MEPTALVNDFVPPTVTVRPDDPRFLEDVRLHIEFRRHPVLHPFKSQKEGRAIYEEKDFIRIHIPGDKNNIIDRPVDEIDEVRFADKLAKWRAGQAEAVTGTPLTALPTMTPAKIAEYQYFNIRTIEQLAHAADSFGAKFMGFHSDKARAKAFLDVAAGNAPLEKMNEELAKRDEVIETLRAQVEALAVSQKKKPD